VPAKPDAMFVVGFKAWLELGYCVTKGQSAIRIIARLRIKERDPLSGEPMDFAVWFEVQVDE
jgi:hypothetical protein